MVLTNYLRAIADAIREVEQSSDEINAKDFPDRIRALSGGQPTPPTPTGDVFEQLYRDLVVIPDKYNTGCDVSTLSKYDVTTDPFTLAGGWMRGTTAGAEYTFDLRQDTDKALKNITTDHITWENIDFTDFTGISWLGTSGERIDGATYPEIWLTFKNCLIPVSIASYDVATWLHITFENCTILRVAGTADLDKCLVGGEKWWRTNYPDSWSNYAGTKKFGDPLNPMSNCTIKNSYVYDVQFPTDVQGTAHIDGIQTQEITNFTMENCRLETPIMNYTYSQGNYNAVMYIQRQITSGNFKDIIANGGAKILSISECTDTDIEIRYGVDTQYLSQTTVYDSEAPNYAGPICDGICEIHQQKDIYVSSVINNGTQISIIATNDTGADRDIIISTNNGDYNYTIPAINWSEKLEIDSSWSSTNIDTVITLPATNVEYIVCYDNDTQIRFVDFTEDKRHTK